MTTVKTEKLPLLTEEDIVKVRHVVQLWMKENKFSLIEQTKMVTATSELARNTLIHGGGGIAIIENFIDHNGLGIKACFQDHGAGIADIALALKDGFSTGHGLGLGLGGAKRLVHHFEILSAPGQGTQVTITLCK